MGRYPCCKDDDDNLKKGPWTEDEDEKLIDYIKKNGHTNWQSLARKAGLNRCGKSCRLRWNNYLRPDIKRGRFSPEEEEIIINLHSDLGNKWSKIAAHLPGRTDNEIKNFYNTHLRKKLLRLGIDPKTHKPISKLNSLVNLSHHLTSNSNYFLSLASVLSLQAQFSLLAKIQQVIQSPLPTINTNLLSSIQGNILSNSSPQLESLRNEAEMSKFLDSSLANTTTTPCLDNTNLVLPNDYSSISNFSDDPLGTFDKIGTIQKRLVCPKHQDNGTQRTRNGPNFTNFCQASELDSSANCVEGLAKSSNIDTIYLFPSLVPSTPENSNLNQNDIPTFSELDDISAWEVPEDDEAITSLWNSIF